MATILASAAYLTGHKYKGTITIFKVILFSPKGGSNLASFTQELKDQLRFNHELTGSLLCTAGMDCKDAVHISFFLLLAALTTFLCLIVNRMRENLRSGKMLVCRDQWPIFLYTHHTFDAEDLWSGLLRSCLLICVSRYFHVVILHY